MKKIELLVPAKNFEYLKIAIKNGADCIYLSTKKFNARALNQENNFTEEELIDAIKYCHEHNVKAYLTINTLIKNNELDEAYSLADLAYKNNIDAIIVQDIGFGKNLINKYKNLDIHASTQNTITNSTGVNVLKELGFKRVILSRELSIDEINSICQNCNLEIETFIHGGLCISYSGQCLFSSLNYGMAGNRGMCVGSCRNDYLLIKNDVVLKSGKLLKPRDLYGIEYIPQLIKSGVCCLKVQGRTRNIDYIEKVTKIYRKYIDLALSNEEYIISKNDLLELQTVSKRGLSKGHFDKKGNDNFIVDLDNKLTGKKIKKINEENDIQIINGRKICTELSILLNEFIIDEDYSKLSKNIKNVYIPLEKFTISNKENIDILSKKFNLFVYLPMVILEKDLCYNDKLIEDIVKTYKVDGFVLSNLSDIRIIDKFKNKYKYVSNYTMNVFNIESCKILNKLGVGKVTISVELSNEEVTQVSSLYNKQMEKIVYGRLPLINMKYCMINNKTCLKKSFNNESYYIRDINSGEQYECINYNNQIITKIFANKILSLIPSVEKNFSLRADFLNESVDKINLICEDLINGKYYIGEKYFNDIKTK